MVTGVPEPTLDALTRFGHHLGMCFQIVDDVLDLTASDDALGKPAGQDLLEGIYTLPVIYALARVARALRPARATARPRPAHRGARLATRNGAVETALGVARDHAVKARDALDGADGLDAEVSEELGRLVDGLVTREN